MKAPAEFAEGIIDLQHDVGSRNLFSNHSLATFWIRSRPISPISQQKSTTDPCCFFIVIPMWKWIQCSCCTENKTKEQTRGYTCRPHFHCTRLRCALCSCSVSCIALKWEYIPQNVIVATLVTYSLNVICAMILSVFNGILLVREVSFLRG